MTPLHRPGIVTDSASAGAGAGGAGAGGAGAGGAAAVAAEATASPEATALALADAAVALGIELCVFDFDLCLLRIHTFALKLQAADVAQRDVAADFVDLHFFAVLTRALVNRGVRVAIASFGVYDVIQAYLDAASALPQGAELLQTTALFTTENISTPTSVGGDDGVALESKNLQLARLCSDYGASPRTVLFFDDDGWNIDAALAAGYRYAVHCPQGFAAPSFRAAIDQLEGRSTAEPLRKLKGVSQLSIPIMVLAATCVALAAIFHYVFLHFRE